MKNVLFVLPTLFILLISVLCACHNIGIESTPVNEISNSENLMFYDDFEDGKDLQTLGYTGNTKDGISAFISNEMSTSGEHSISFPTAGLNLRKKFDENGRTGVSAEWNVNVPTTGSFATNLMQNSSSVVRTILFSGNWYYYNENAERVLLSPYSYNEWINLKITLDSGFFNAYINDSLVAENVPTLAGLSKVNTIYYSVGSKTAYVDDIRVDLKEPALPKDFFVTSQVELTEAIDSALPGDTITMKNGVWNNIDIIFKANGTAQQQITLRAETAGAVIISGSSSVRIAGEYLVIDGLNFKNGSSSRSLHLIEFRDGQTVANNCRITNISISNFNKPNGTDVWVGLFGSHNRVDHSLFEGKESESVLMIVWRSTPDANYHLIDHNHFKDIPSIGLGGATAIRIGDGTHALSSSYTTVEANIFENMLGIGKIVNIKSGGNTIRGNTFIKASGSICIRQGNNNLIEGNYILPGLQDNYTGGILIIGENHIVRNNYIQGTRQRGKAAIVLYEGEPNNHPGKGGYYPTKNVTIENNTLVDNDKNILIGQYYDPNTEMTIPVENITYKRNAIVGNNTTIPIIESLDAPIGNILYEDNIFYNGNFTGLEGIEGIQIEDPLLTIGQDSLYHYAPNSPLRDNILAPPLQRNEVGPTWVNQN